MSSNIDIIEVNPAKNTSKKNTKPRRGRLLNISGKTSKISFGPAVSLNPKEYKYEYIITPTIKETIIFIPTTP